MMPSSFAASLRSLFGPGRPDRDPAPGDGLFADLLDFAGERAGQGPQDQFASWLPYSAYLADEQVFVNRDTLGFLLEVMPQSGADERMVEILLSMYATCPKGAGIQIMLFSSPHLVEPLRQ
jgi:conjugal transfer ATP-binding protein TraC